MGNDQERRISVTELQRDIDDVFDQVVAGETRAVTSRGLVTGRLLPPDMTERGRPTERPRSGRSGPTAS
ncbi:antitoxin Phd_YefM of type II toxin-antitoxin system [Nocardiopsis sp. Huas11]|uniref:type II toxin-antitoxin system Phd/YefM family antitoxin n=1 Tax=Nocardiopsis sp. Huas11 TaxID=2183912 RepID=UPI000EACB5F3|nr:type II toxin-antitoxin system Phd/YefM family antitoxin [Nocardiopsis sp. Huas11]RKS06309.1 antitoxin Phd_YefM of type II toxin-antitoxin system [Nocardiopsis sp. Huas11]